MWEFHYLWRAHHGGRGGREATKTENAAIALVKEGLATVHSYSADGLPWAKQLYDAEEEAKKEHRCVSM